MNAPDTRTEAQAYLDAMVSRRGYVLGYHKTMAANDFPVWRDVVGAEGLEPTEHRG